MDEAARQRFLEQLERLRQGYVDRLRQRADELDALRERMRADDREALARVEDIVHQMAGTAGSYGLVELSHAATELDARIKQGAAPIDLDAGLDALISLLRRTA